MHAAMGSTPPQQRPRSIEAQGTLCRGLAASIALPRSVTPVALCRWAVAEAYVAQRVMYLAAWSLAAITSSTPFRTHVWALEKMIRFLDAEARSRGGPNNAPTTPCPTTPCWPIGRRSVSAPFDFVRRRGAPFS